MPCRLPRRRRVVCNILDLSAFWTPNQGFSRLHDYTSPQNYLTYHRLTCPAGFSVAAKVPCVAFWIPWVQRKTYLRKKIPKNTPGELRRTQTKDLPSPPPDTDSIWPWVWNPNLVTSVSVLRRLWCALGAPWSENGDNVAPLCAPRESQHRTQIDGNINVTYRCVCDLNVDIIKSRHFCEELLCWVFEENKDAITPYWYSMIIFKTYLLMHRATSIVVLKSRTKMRSQGMSNWPTKYIHIFE